MDAAEKRRVGKPLEKLVVAAQDLGGARQRRVGLRVDGAQLAASPRGGRDCAESRDRDWSRLRATFRPIARRNSCSSDRVDVEQRANQVIAPRRHRRKAARARAARQPQNHGLRLIVAGMRDRDAIGLRPMRSPPEKTLARVAPGDFDRHLVRLRIAGHVGIADHRGHAEPIGERPAERRVRVGLGAANVMIEMREPGEHDLAARGEVAQQERERDRVGSAGHRRDHTRARRPERMPGGVATHAIDEI